MSSTVSPKSINAGILRQLDERPVDVRCKMVHTTARNSSLFASYGLLADSLAIA